MKKFLVLMAIVAGFVFVAPQAAQAGPRVSVYVGLPVPVVSNCYPAYGYPAYGYPAYGYRTYARSVPVYYGRRYYSPRRVVVRTRAYPRYGYGYSRGCW